MERLFFSLGALLAAGAVAAGAYGAHGGETTLGAEQARWIAKAARYQMYHAFGLLILAWASTHWQQGALLFQIAGGLFVLGVVCFCGSLYLMAFTGANPGYVTPFGGIAFMLGWLALLGGAWK